MPTPFRPQARRVTANLLRRSAALGRCGRAILRALSQHCRVLDTLPIARQLHPGQRNSLDALCKRYSVDNSGRDLHGALLDAKLLSEVYLAMTGGQAAMAARYTAKSLVG